MNDDEEAQRLRSVAMQNAESVFLARQRAEEELLRTKEALELKTQELAHSLAMTRATLESTTDGILATDRGGKVTSFNERFLQMWRLPPGTMESKDHRQIVNAIGRNFREPVQFLDRIEEIYASAPPESYDLLELADGRVFERFSRIQYLDDQNIGRVWSLRDISERRLAEEALAKQSERFRVTLASIGDAVIATDTKGRVAYLNGVAEFLTGWDQNDAAGEPLSTVFRIVNQFTRKPVENPAMKAIEEGVIVGLANHTILIARDGTERPIDDSAAPIKDALGVVVGCVLIFRDVSEQHESLRALEQSEARKTAMFETALDCIISIDQTGAIVEFNAAAERTFGHRRKDVLGRELAAILIPPALRERHRQGLAQYLVTGEGPVLNQRIEVFALRADGTEIPVELTVTRIPVEGPPLFTAYLRDISDRMQAEASLRESEARYRAIGEAIDYGVWMCDAEGRNTYASESFLRLVGITQLQCSEFGWGEVLHPEDAEKTMLAWRECVRSGGVWDREHRFRGVDGEWHFVLARGVPIRNDAGQVMGWAGINLDISRLKRAEQSLREADHRKDEFLAMLAHELRNPLAPIRNAVQVLRFKGDTEQTVQSVSEMMERQISQLVRLVDDLLDISRATRGKIELRKERIELAAVVNHAVEACHSQYSSMGHELTVLLPPQPVILNADPTRLTQVVGNLLNNACKFTDKGGRIELAVSIECAATHEKSGEKDVTRMDQTNTPCTAVLTRFALIRVRDNGIGIAADQLPRIFEMFVQVDTSLERSVSGLGIGLTLVKNLVEMHDGTISVQSAGAGRGSEFIVRLPIADVRLPIEEAEDDTNRKSKIENQKSRRILVVDDNRDAAISLALLLNLAGNETQTRFDGQAAVEAAASFKPDAVLLDIGLPKLNGYEAARMIRAQPQGKSIVLVALTGWGQAEDRRKSREAGFDGHMVKPVDLDALKTLLIELLPTNEAS